MASKDVNGAIYNPRYVQEQIERKQNYAADDVEPMFTQLVDSLLTHRPSNVRAFVEAWLSNNASTVSSAEQDESNDLQSYLENQVDPLLQQLMRKIIIEEPEDVRAFALQALKSMPSLSEKEAATKIQCGARGLQARRRVQHVREEKAAVKIQAGMRGMHTRKQLGNTQANEEQKT